MNQLNLQFKFINPIKFLSGIIVAIFLSLSLHGQDLTGEWKSKFYGSYDNYNYTIFLKRINDSTYYGVSNMKQIMSLEKYGNIEFENALERRPKAVRQLIGKKWKTQIDLFLGIGIQSK